VIVLHPQELTRRGDTLKKYAETIIVKNARIGPSGLLARRISPSCIAVEARCRRRSDACRALHHRSRSVPRHEVLIATDDVRNVFALTPVLEANGMEVRVFAENEGLIEGASRRTGRRPHPDDIIMPEMDGYQTMQPCVRSRLRRSGRSSRSLPNALRAIGEVDRVGRHPTTSRAVDTYHFSRVRVGLYH